MNKERIVRVVAAWLGLMICVVIFHWVAPVIATAVPFAHLVFAPFGSTLISTVVFATVIGWRLLSWLSPNVFDRPTRSIAQVVGMMISLVWIAYAGFWLFLYLRGGI
jgi:hypothetical protein